MQRISIFTILWTLLIFLGACGASPTQETAGSGSESEVMVMQPWARPTLTDGGNSAVYLTIMNHTEADDVLLKVSTEVAEATELHETKVDENDVMQMSPLKSLSVPAGDTVSLEPGGKHIMLMGLGEGLQVGDTVEVTLTFQKAGEVVVEAEVRDTAGGGHEGHDDHGDADE